MNNVVSIPQPSDLENFVEFLFDGMEGYMYVVAKVPDDKTSWDQAFFSYPEQVEVAIKAIKTYANSHEVYIAPALFKSKNATKESVKATQVLWCDFDGNTPEEFDLPPSFVICSSEPGHEHVYWKLDNPLTDVPAIEDLNRRLCYKYGADVSGWDATQVLRPPYTINHKHGNLPVTVSSSVPELAFSVAVFDDLAPAPEKTVDYSLWEKVDLPSLNDVIYQNKFGADFKILFEKQKDEIHDRSKSLTNMAYVCAEAGLSDREIYVILSHLALRWGKFEHHTPNSRARQLISIIEHTRIKYPHSNSMELDSVTTYSPKSLLNTDIKVDWAIPNMLMDRGIMMFSGPGGLGKSQIAMQFQAHLAMGVPFLHYPIEVPKKVGFMSLEMGEHEVKSFLESMYPKWEAMYGPEKINLLNENWQIIPFGEALPLNASMGQSIMIQYLEQYQWEGVFVDSVGKAVIGNLNSSEAIQPFTNFNDKLRKRYGCFLWYIHHFRKPPPGQKSYGGAEDNYGDVYLFNSCTSNYTLTKAKNEMLRVRNPKQRHAPEEHAYLLRREEGLYFTHQGEEDTGDTNPLDNIIKQVQSKKTKPEFDASPMPFKKDTDE